jgi:hypothetical protein
VHRAAALGTLAGPQLKITGVEQRLSIGFQSCHGTSQDMSGWMQTEVERRLGGWWLQFPMTEGLAEFQYPLRSEARNSGAHQPACGFRQDDRRVARRMVGMGVAYEDPFAGPHRDLWVHPNSQLGKMKATVPILELQG